MKAYLHIVFQVNHLKYDMNGSVYSFFRSFTWTTTCWGFVSNISHPHSVTTQPFWIFHWEFIPLIYTTRVTLKKRMRRVAIKKTGRKFQCVMTSFYETCTTTLSITFEASDSSPIYHRWSTTVVLNWQTSFEYGVTKQIVTRTTSRLSRHFSVYSPNHVEKQWT